MLSGEVELQSQIEGIISHVTMKEDFSMTEAFENWIISLKSSKNFSVLI